MLAALRMSELLTSIKLPPLSGYETAQLACAITERTVYSELSDQFYADTGGNPLFVVEELRGMQRAVQVHNDELRWSPVMKQVIRKRLLHLSEQTRSLIHIAAVVGRPCSVELLIHASQADPATVGQQTELFVEQRIFREIGNGSVDFSHDLLRDTAYQDVGKSARYRLHMEVAQALEAVHS